ncbi:MAG TPA: potassium/proton antiporter [Kofleriaceae bacterium]|nr:potassium/proton antiporter [Kofleriaceae bacterium]
MEPIATASILAIVGALLIVAALVSQVSNRVGVPVLLIFLVIGMAAGSEGVAGLVFDDYALAFRLGTMALVLILFDGGLNTPLASFRRALWPASLLATVGVVLTAAGLAGVALLLGLPIEAAVLVAVVVSSTDAAAVFATLRSSGVRLRSRVGSILEVESGLNDPMAIVLTMAAAEWAMTGSAFGLGELVSLLAQFAIGVAGGLAAGFAGRTLLRVVQLPATGLYPVLTIALAFGTFGGVTLIGGSGFLAVYLAGLVLGKSPLPYRAGILRVQDALAWLAQILMFLVLGLLVFPSRLVPDALLGVTLALALTFLARPAAVLLTILPFRMPWRERAFLSLVGLRGAVPIVLGAYPVLVGVPFGERLFHLVFFIVLVSALVPGATVSWLARRFKVTRAVLPEAPAGIDLVSARDYAGEFIWYYVLPPAAVAGAAVHELPLPERCVIVLLVRGEEIIPARGNTTFAPGDHVCIFVNPEDRSLLDLMFGMTERDDD